MTREEEIINAATEARMASAETLTTRGTHHSIDDVPFVDKMITYDEVAENAFIKGAEWADTHPINVWHNASEEPQQGRLMLGIESDDVAIYKWIGQDPKGWPSFIKDTGLSKWAYIDDLLPKE